ncbi:ABC transporter [Enterococcus phage vB_Efs19_KEN17]
MKLIDGEALLNEVKSHIDYSPEDDYDDGWNDALEMCAEIIKQDLVKAKKEASEAPIAIGGNPFTTGYLTPSEMSLKAPDSVFKVLTEDNTLTALKLVRDAIEDNYSDEEALIYVNGMIAALEM